MWKSEIIPKNFQYFKVSIFWFVPKFTMISGLNLNNGDNFRHKHKILEKSLSPIWKSKIVEFLCEKSEKKAMNFQNPSLKSLTFLSVTIIWKNFSLKPPRKFANFFSENSAIVRKHFENLTLKVKSVTFFIWTAQQTTTRFCVHMIFFKRLKKFRPHCLIFSDNKQQ